MAKKVIVITGGSRGIGAATAQLAASRGYAVCISYISNASAAADIVRAIENVDGQAIAVRADIAREEDVLRLFESCDGKSVV